MKASFCCLYLNSTRLYYSDSNMVAPCFDSANKKMTSKPRKTTNVTKKLLKNSRRWSLMHVMILHQSVVGAHQWQKPRWQTSCQTFVLAAGTMTQRLCALLTNFFMDWTSSTVCTPHLLIRFNRRLSWYTGSDVTNHDSDVKPTRTGSKHFCWQGIDRKVSALEQITRISANVSGRTLHWVAKEVLCNCKKMTAIVTASNSPYKDGNFP